MTDNTSVPRGAQYLEPQLRRSLCSSSLGLFPGLDVQGEAKSWHQSWQPVLGIMWVSPDQNVSLESPIPAAADCQPARCRAPSASSGSRCWLNIKLRVSLRSCPRQMQWLQEACVSHLRGGEEGRRLITAWRWTCGPNRGVCSSWRLGTVPREPHPSREELFLSAERQLFPGDSSATTGIPWPQAARDKELPLPSHPACCRSLPAGSNATVTRLWAVKAVDSDSSLGEG